MAAFSFEYGLIYGSRNLLRLSFYFEQVNKLPKVVICYEVTSGGILPRKWEKVMTDKEFQRLKRAELVEIIYELQKNEAALQRENDELRKRLEKKELSIANAGSIAEAALGLNGVFDAAQTAADQYLEEIQRVYRRADEEASKTVEDAKIQAAEILQQVEDESRTLREQTKSDVERMQKELNDSVRQILQDHTELRFLLKEIQKGNGEYGREST